MIKLVSLLVLCAASSSLPRHLLDAQLMVDNIQPQYNAYQHKDCYLKWIGVEGATRYECRADCSDFLALLLEHSYGVTPDQFRQWTGERRPYANHWHDAIVAGRGFTQITKLSDAQPGDVLAVKFPPHSTETGHIMLICEPPVGITAKNPIVPDTQQWNVTIIDSTRSPHGKGDTRISSDGTSGQGVGRGVIRIFTNSDGSVAGYCWSDGSKSKFESQDERNLVIGRLDVAK